jgi:hypothetical protein
MNVFCKTDCKMETVIGSTLLMEHQKSHLDELINR